MMKYIDIDITSFNAVTIGPEATAGSIPIFSKNIGDKTPKKVPAKQAPVKPRLTINPKAGELIIMFRVMKYFKKETIMPHAMPKTTPVNKPVKSSFKITSNLVFLEITPRAIPLTKTVEH